MQFMYINFTFRILPIVIVVAILSSLVATTDISKDANACSCWCVPFLGNVLPFSLEWDEVS